MKDVTVTLQDMRSVRMCARGARPWFARQGLSWNDFVTHGLPASRLRATGDPLALKVVEAAEARDRA